jgi:hypothetical protein
MTKRHPFRNSLAIIASITCLLLITPRSTVYAAWGIQTLDGGSGTESGRHCSLALDSGGRVHVAYTKIDAGVGFFSLKYVTNQLGSADAWDILPIDAPPNKSVGAYNSIFIDSADHVHVAYYSTGDLALKYATSSAWPTWFTQTVDSQGNVGQDTDIVVDAAGGIHISYFDETNDSLKYAYKPAAGAWSTETVLDLACATPDDPNCRVGEYTSIGLDSSGNPHIIFYTNTYGYLQHATKSSGSWSIEIVSNTIWAEHETSLAMDGNHLHVSFYSVSDRDLMYATNATGNWVVETAHHNGNDIGKFSSIGLDSGGKVHISYYDETEGDLEYTNNTSGYWMNQTVSAYLNSGSETSLAIGNDRVHIGFYAMTENSLKYALYDPDAPYVQSTVPADQAQNARLNHAVLAAFSEAMDAASLSASNFYLRDEQSNPVSGAVAYDATSHIAVFTPSSDFTPNTVYTATLSKNVTDAGGTPMARDVTFSFTTGIAVDSDVPYVESSIPANAGSNIARNSSVMVLFSEEIDPTTLTTSSFRLLGEDLSGGGLYNDAVAGTVAYDAGNRIAVFSPDAALDPNRNYRARLTTAIADLSGTSMAANYPFNFATANTTDTTPVSVFSVSPAEDAVGVLKAAPVIIQFDEAVNPLTLTSDNLAVSESTTVKISYDWYTYAATLTFGNRFASSKIYTATAIAGIEDLCGNQLNPAKQWAFRATPGVKSTWPQQGANNIDPEMHREIEATFYGDMDPGTIDTASFVLSRNGTNVPGSTVTYDAPTRTARLRVADALTLYSGATYTVTVTTAAQDAYGAGLEQNYGWNFTTSGSPNDSGSGWCFISSSRMK